METRKFDYLVIGSGLAGLAFALRASTHGTVGVITKAEISESNTQWAQGGIAAAVGEADSWELHERDTLIAGAGLCDEQAVRFLVQEAPAAIQWLVDLGAEFDSAQGGELSLGREGGHSRHRIVHHADKTGAEVERAVEALAAAIGERLRAVPAAAMRAAAGPSGKKNCPSTRSKGSSAWSWRASSKAEAPRSDTTWATAGRGS